MSGANEEIVRRLYREVWNGENPEAAEELIGEAYEMHERDLPDRDAGPAKYRGLVEMTRDIFPDMTFVIEDLIAVDDRVAVRWTMRGTHEGAAYGMEPTGRAVEMTGIEINRLADGRLVETWTQSDQLGMMAQIGALDQ